MSGSLYQRKRKIRHSFQSLKYENWLLLFVICVIKLNISVIFNRIILKHLFYSCVLSLSNFLTVSVTEAFSEPCPFCFFFCVQKNGTHEGEFVFHTGEENYMDFGKIDTWNGMRYKLTPGPILYNISCFPR